MRIAVFGLGYVGAVTAAGLASRGHDVTGVDVDATKVATVQRGHSPIVEPGLEELIGDAVRAGRLQATTRAAEAIAGADISLVCVGTPSTAHGATDLIFLRRALEDIRSAMDLAMPPESGFHSIVIRSTVPPGTGADYVAPVFAPGTLPTGWAVGTAMCPEFLREGTGIDDFFAPPFVVLGTAEPRTLASIAELFGSLGQEVERVEVSTAEALKYACNAFHATKVSFANEVARVFRHQGVDAREVMRIFCQDHKLNLSSAYLRPGLAFGGSCLPKDLRSMQHLARLNNVDVPLLLGTTMSNELVVRDVVERIIDTNLRRVTLLGLSFKSNTDDLRESPSVDLAERLLGKGFEVRIYDPVVNPDRLVGANRRQVEARLPHLRRLLACSPDEALYDAEVAVVSCADVAVREALTERPPRVLIDLHGGLGAEVEELAAYQGGGW